MVCESSSMAAFVSLVTCQHCPVTSTRRGLIYRDSLSALSRNLRAPGGPRQPPGPRPQGFGLQGGRRCRLNRPELPESTALARSKQSGSMKHLVLAHLRRMLTPSPAQQQRGLRLPG
ncbi:uncharacterized protein LOC143420988 [Maylandia zebra]|uniref:uncharacterized protein LOC143414246 n=1 Tax=Maylandia zebra TaxID=106582 RepID=UPI00403C7F9F